MGKRAVMQAHGDRMVVVQRIKTAFKKFGHECCRKEMAGLQSGLEATILITRKATKKKIGKMHKQINKIPGVVAVMVRNNGIKVQFH